MRVLITHEIFPPEFTGGGEFLMLKIAEILKKNGFQVKVLTSGKPEIKSYKGIETVRIPINRYLMNFTLPFILKYGSQADVILTTSGNLCFPSWLASKVLKKPIVCYVNHILGPYWKDVRGKIAGRIFEFFEKIFLSRDFDAIIFQNNSALALGKKIGLKAKRIFLIHPGVDFKKFKPRKKENFVLFVGSVKMDKSLIKLKGLEYLIEAAKKLPETKFVIVGGGKDLENLKKIAPENVIFKGILRGKALSDVYGKALIFCLPSLSEGFGLSILEAMASGCAIVSTISIGQVDKIIKRKSSEEISKRIISLIRNKEFTVKIGKKNRRLAKHYTWERFENELVEVFKLILKKKKIMI
ncbi:MAG: glycosyltransferase family 4 protein [Candidatus Aenigmatarchaeota archaeon]